MFMSVLQFSVLMRPKHEILKSEVLSYFQEEFILLLFVFFFTVLAICKFLLTLVFIPTLPYECVFAS